MVGAGGRGWGVSVSENGNVLGVRWWWLHNRAKTFTLKNTFYQKRRFTKVYLYGNKRVLKAGSFNCDASLQMCAVWFGLCASRLTLHEPCTQAPSSVGQGLFIPWSWTRQRPWVNLSNPLDFQSIMLLLPTRGNQKTGKIHPQSEEAFCMFSHTWADQNFEQTGM